VGLALSDLSDFLGDRFDPGIEAHPVVMKIKDDVSYPR